MGLQLLRTTQSTQAKDGKFRSGSRHSRKTASLQPQLVGMEFGHLTVISPRIRFKDGYRWVKAKCNLTGIERWTWWDAVNKGICKSFARNGMIQDPLRHRIGRRFDDIFQRCNNPKHPSYVYYGERGIECRMDRKDFIDYVLEHLPHPTYRGLEIDRINNNSGHYEPGNLRLATRREQNLNKRNNVWITFRGESVLVELWPSPYSRSWTLRLVQQGLTTGEEIIAQAQRAKPEKRKSWPKIQARLDELGYTT
jgi:hypothetical protein